MMYRVRQPLATGHSRRRARALLALVLFSLAPRPAAANHAIAFFRGEQHGPLSPRRSTNIRVEGEELSFEVPDDLSDARVTAVYRMKAEAAESAEVAFVFVRALRSSLNMPPVSASVEIDGAPIEYRVVTDGELLEPRLRAWIDERPELSRALRGAAEARRQGASEEEILGPLRAAGGPCAPSCDGLIQWYELAGLPARDVFSLRREWALDAAREAIPEAVEELQRDWSTLAGDRRLGFLLFPLEFVAGGARTVRVRYEHRPTVDRRERVPGVWIYEYLLSPAQRWASFGPLDVQIRAPGGVQFAANLPLQREGDVFRAHLQTLPPGELTFSLMPTRGLWLGLSRHEHYWAILGAAIGFAALLAGVFLGRAWASRPRWQRVVFGLLVAGPLAALAALGVQRLLLLSFPRDALGFDNGYFDRPDSDFLVPLGGLAGALVALLASLWRRKARLTPARQTR